MARAAPPSAVSLSTRALGMLSWPQGLRGLSLGLTHREPSDKGKSQVCPAGCQALQGSGTYQGTSDSSSSSPALGVSAHAVRDPLPAPPNVAGLDFKSPFQPQWFYDFILAAPRLPPGPDPMALGALHTWAQVNHSSTHSSFPCQRFIPCQTPNPSARAGLARGFECQQQPQPSWPWLNTGESPGRLCLTLPALIAAPFPAEKTQPYLPNFAMKQPPSWGRGCHRLSSSLSQQERPNPLRGRGEPRLGTSTESNFEAS